MTKFSMHKTNRRNPHETMWTIWQVRFDHTRERKSRQKVWTAITTVKIAGPIWGHEMCEYSHSSRLKEGLSYITDLFESRLSCARQAEIYTFFDKPCNVEKSIYLGLTCTTQAAFKQIGNV